MTVLRTFFAIAFFTVFSHAHAGETKPDASNAAQALLKQLDSIQAMSGDFVQVSHDQKGNTLQQQHGHFSVARGGEFVWEIAKPYAQTIVSDGKSLRIYDPDLQQLTIKLLDKNARVAPLLLFSEGNRTIEKDYRIARIAPDSFELASIEKSGLFDKLRIHFAGANPDTLQIVDSLQQTTDVSFTHLMMNPALPPATFVFDAPAGVEVIDERQDATKQP